MCNVQRLSSARVRHPVRARRHGDSQWVGLMADAERRRDSRDRFGDDDDECNMTLDSSAQLYILNKVAATPASPENRIAR